MHSTYKWLKRLQLKCTRTHTNTQCCRTSTLVFNNNENPLTSIRVFQINYNIFHFKNEPWEQFGASPITAAAFHCPHFACFVLHLNYFKCARGKTAMREKSVGQYTHWMQNRNYSVRNKTE